MAATPSEPPTYVNIHQSSNLGYIYQSKGDELFLFGTISNFGESMELNPPIFNTFEWNAAIEALLFDCLEQYHPFGLNRESHLFKIQSILQNYLDFQDHLESRPVKSKITCKDILDHLQQYFNFEAVLNPIVPVVYKTEKKSSTKHKKKKHSNFTSSFNNSPIKVSPVQVNLPPFVQVSTILPLMTFESQSKRKLEDDFVENDFAMDLNDEFNYDFITKQNKRQRESTDIKSVINIKPMSSETMERTKARCVRLESVVAQCTSSNSVKYTTFTEVIYAALKSLKQPADLDQICNWISKNSAILDPSFANRIDFGKSTFKSSVRSTLHNNSVFKRETSNDSKSQGKWTLLFD